MSIEIYEVQRIISQYGGYDITNGNSQKRLREIGFDSLDAAEVTLALEERCKIDLKDEFGSRVLGMTTGEITNYINDIILGKPTK